MIQTHALNLNISNIEISLIIPYVLPSVYIFQSKIEQHKNDIKSTWKVLNEILNRNNRRRQLPSVFNHNSIEISDPKEIADQFCKYFTNIGPSLASKIPRSLNSFSHFLPERLVNSVFLELVYEEVIDICNSFRSSAAPGFDNISMGTIKECINCIISPLTSIFNLSITTGAMCVCVYSPLHTYGDIHLKTHQQSGVCSSYGDIFESPQKKSS